MALPSDSKPPVKPDAASAYMSAGQTGGGGADVPRFIVDRVRPEFWLAFNPNSYDAYELPDIPAELAAMAKKADLPLKSGPIILPTPIQLLIKAGINGIGTRPKTQSHEDYMAQFHATAAKNKQILISPVELIPEWAKPPGSRSAGYRVAWPATPARQPGVEAVHFGEVWDVPTGPNAEGVMRWKYDRAIQALWISWLVCRGIIKPAEMSRVEDARRLAAAAEEKVHGEGYENDHARGLALKRRRAAVAAINAPVLGVEVPA